MNKFEEGALWRKWDLHVHTPMSVFNNNFNIGQDENENINNYIYQLFTKAIENNIEAIGLTDYFSIDGYEIIKKNLEDEEKLKIIFKEKIKEDEKFLDKIKNIALFPNVELRLNLMVIYNNKRQEKVEAHVIFDNQVPIEEIRENFFGRLFLPTDVMNSGTNNGSFTKRNIEKLGEKIKKEQPEFLGLSDYEAGCEVAYVNFDDLKRLLSENFLHRSILLLVEDNITDINWNNQGHWIRKTHYAQCDGLMSSNPKTIKWGLLEQTKEEFSTFKPCFWGSDAHTFDKMFKPEMDRFCWIKADLNFNGLKQVLINPHERIFIGKIAPELDNYIHNKPNKIENIEIKKCSDSCNKDIWFDVDMKLNPYMTTIIGNKGSGKSALSDIIALVCNSKNMTYASFLNKDRFKKSPENYANDYTAKIRWADKEQNCKNHISENVEETSVELVQFLPQRYIENVCSGIGDEFKTEIENAIFSYMDTADKEGCTSLSQLINKKTSTNYLACQDLKNQLEQINIKINELEYKKTTQNKKAIEEKIKNLELSLNRHLNSKPEKVDVPKNESENPKSVLINKLDEKYKIIDIDYNTKTSRLQTINSQLTNITNFINKNNLVIKDIDDINKDYIELAKSLSLNKKEYISFKINDSDLKLYSEKLIKEKSELELLVSNTDVELNKIVLPEEFVIDNDNIEKMLNRYDSLFSKMHIIKLIKNALINQTSLENQNYQKYLKDLREWDEKRKQIIGEKDGYPDGSIKTYSDEKKYIDETLQSDLEKLYNDRQKIISGIYDMYIKNCEIMKKIYNPIEEKLKNTLELMEERISFDVQVVANNNLSAEILNRIDQRISGFFYGKQSGNSNLQDIIDKTKFNDKKELLEFVSKIYSEVTSNIDDTQKILNNRVTEFYNYIGSLEYLESVYALKLGNKNLKQLSPGERGIVLLIFYLSLNKSNIPLIIDQPEDNLDNQSVYNKLVPCIKEAKKHRQVIIVTHNPNIAIACDSEQIIYCEINKNTNKISYESGSIENPVIRQRVIDVLEGTMPAFDLRRKKYTN